MFEFSSTIAAEIVETQDQKTGFNLIRQQIAGPNTRQGSGVWRTLGHRPCAPASYTHRQPKT